MAALKNALLNLISCVPISWLLAILVLGTIGLSVFLVMLGLHFFA